LAIRQLEIVEEAETAVEDAAEEVESAAGVVVAVDEADLPTRQTARQGT